MHTRPCERGRGVTDGMKYAKREGKKKKKKKESRGLVCHTPRRVMPSLHNKRAGDNNKRKQKQKR